MLDIVNEYIIILLIFFIFVYSQGFVLKKNPGYPEYDEKIIDEEAKVLVGKYNTGLLITILSVNILVMLTL